MNCYQKIDGAVLKSAREYDIAPDTQIKAGQVVKLTAGLVVAAAAGETGALLGVAAEQHTGADDALNPRSHGKKIMVWDDPDLVMQCRAPEIEVTSGTATTIVASGIATFANDDFNGGYVKLISKAEDSTNTDEIGHVRRITDFVAADKSFTLEDGGTPAAGDVYAVFPPIGFAKGNLNDTRTGLVLTATASLSLKVMGHDHDLGKINLIPGKHVFAVN